jgi:TolA-binding protein
MMRFSCLIFSFLLLWAELARGDTIWIASGGGGAPITFGGVTILRVEEGRIVFRTQAGAEAMRPLAHVVRIELDDEPDLTTAEQAFASGDWNRAVQAYQQVLRSTGKSWLREWASIRLLQAANHSGQFGAAVAGYVAAVAVDPGRTADHRPSPADQPQRELDAAVRQLDQALHAADLPARQQQALLSLLMEVHRARADTAEAARAAEQLIGLVDTNADDPVARRLLADARLSLARLALDRHQYQQALEQIEPHRALFDDPARQSTALFCIAEARAGLAIDSDDPEVHQDVALAYMRVVAHVGEQQGNPLVPEALMAVARIHEERLGEPETARRLYQQVAAQYKDHPSAERARQHLEQ